MLNSVVLSSELVPELNQTTQSHDFNLRCYASSSLITRSNNGQNLLFSLTLVKIKLQNIYESPLFCEHFDNIVLLLQMLEAR